MNRKNVWTVTGLIGLYVICQAIADVGATRLIQIGQIVMPAGTFIFALTFTVRDLLHKRLGKEWARAAIVIAGGLNLLQAGYLYTMAKLPPPVFYANADAWNAIFALVPSITLGSIIAEVVSEFVDTEIYHLWWTRFPRAPQWSRVLISNVVSLPLDSLLFGMLAFVILPKLFGGSPLTIAQAVVTVMGQIVWKAVVTVVGLPTIYLVRHQQEGQHA